MSKDTEAITKVIKEYQDAVEAGDVDRWVNVNTDDALYMAPDQPLVSGKAAIKKWAKTSWFDVFTMKYDYVRAKDIEVSGSLAVARTEFRLGVVPKGGGKGMKGDGKAEVVLRKQADGSWKIARQTFNWDAPMKAA